MGSPRVTDGEHTRLPRRLTTFVGRATELAQARALLGTRRLVTFVGAGGCGKTRLAVEVGMQVEEELADGAYLVDLARLTDPALVAVALLDALALPEVNGEDAARTAVTHLREREALVILDNCEHLLSGCRQLLDRLLGDCASVRVLATSREPLGIPGEAVYRVPSLALPEHCDDVEAAAVRLFRDRAELARAPHGIESGELVAVVDICLRLDGIPLAIELAAARCAVLTPNQIAVQLAGRFDIVSTRLSTLPRHRTLAASIDWSYRLLDADEQAVLRRLAVFVGGFTYDSAVAVCAPAAEHPEQVGEIVLGLVERSLIEPHPRLVRYRILEPIRQYLDAELRAAGENDDAARRFAEHFVEVAQEQGRGLDRESAQSRAVLEAELDNLRAADDWLVEHGHTEQALLLLGPLRLYWACFNRSRDGMERIARAWAMPGGTPDARLAAAHAHIATAFMAGLLAEIGEIVADAQDLLDEVADSGPKAQLMSMLGLCAAAAGDEGAPAVLEAAVGLARRFGEPYPIAYCLWVQGLVASQAGRAAVARAWFTESLREEHRADAPYILSGGLLFLGQELVLDGDFDAAEQHLVRVHVLHLELQEQSCIFWVEAGLARLQAAHGDIAEALTGISAALAQAKRRNLSYAMSWCLWVQVLVEHATCPPGAELPSLPEAQKVMASQGCSWSWGIACLHAFAAERAAEAGNSVGARRTLDRAIAVARSPFAGRAWPQVRISEARVWAAGGDLGSAERCVRAALDAAGAEGMGVETIEALELLGALLADRAPEQAARLLAAADSARRERRFVPSARDAASTASALDRARAVLEPAAFADAWAEGTVLSLSDAIAYAARGRGHPARLKPNTGWDSLSPTEAQVSRLAARGLRNADIAAALFVAPSTVKTHLVKAFAKLGVRNRTELAALVPPEAT